MVLVAVIILISTQPTQWTWPLSLWGLLVGVAGASVLEIAARHTFRIEPPNPALLAKWHRRRFIYDGLWLFFGTVAGLLAAALDLVWIDAALTAYAVISLVAGGLVYRAIRRRQAAE
jgi:hypothetical protein